MNNKKLETEKTIIGILLSHNELIAQAVTALSPKFFNGRTQEGKCLRKTYELIVKELTGGGALDHFFLVNFHNFTDSDALSLMNLGASHRNFEHYCGVLKRAYEKQKRQTLPMILDSIEKSSMSEQEKDLAYHEAFQEAMDRTKVNDNPVLHITEAFKQTINEMQAQLERGDKLSGISTGFECLDDRHGGLEAGRVYYIAGRSKMGKTSLAASITKNVVLDGHHAICFSLEMSRSELVKKDMAALGQVDYAKVRQASNLSQDRDWGGITHSLSLLKDTKYFIKDSTRESRESIRADLQSHELKHGKIDLIVIDYPALMDNTSTQEEIRETGRWLKLIANEFQAAVIPLYQINKSIDQRPDKRPMTSDLAYISESDADAVIMVYRDAYYNENSEYGNAAEIITGVARNAEAGTDFLEWQGQYQRFTNLDDSEQHRLSQLKNKPKEERKKFSQKTF